MVNYSYFACKICKYFHSYCMFINRLGDDVQLKRIKFQLPLVCIRNKFPLGFGFYRRLMLAVVVVVAMMTMMMMRLNAVVVALVLSVSLLYCYRLLLPLLSLRPFRMWPTYFVAFVVGTSSLCHSYCCRYFVTDSVPVILDRCWCFVHIFCLLFSRN